MRWKQLLVVWTLLVAVTTGCQKQCFVPECDGKHYDEMPLPGATENMPELTAEPTIPNMPSPATVNETDRKPRYISLAEAIALSLENGIAGNLQLTGTFQDFVGNFPAAAGVNFFSGDNSIRVLSLDPAIAGADIEASLAKFDARWITSMAWQRIDRGVGGNILQNFQNGDQSSLTSSLVKPLPTGGVAGITFRDDYTLLNQPPSGFTNPAYRPFLQFQFDQPLLQGFGVDINELRTTHPGPTPNIPAFNPGAGALPIFGPIGGRVPGILITRIRFDQQRIEFERQVHIMLANVEVAYWNLYAAYWALYSRDAGLRLALATWKLAEAQKSAGRMTAQIYNLYLYQYELFRSQRIQAMGQVLENERQLRGLIGLPVDDCTRLIPVDAPSLAPYNPDWCTALNDALALRPELLLARQDVKLRQLNVINQKNLLLPDLRFTSAYNVNGLGTHMGGGPEDPNNAFASIASGRFSDWALGLRLDVPLGFRDAHAALRSARLQLAESYGILQDQEKRAARYLGLEYQKVFENYQQIQAQKALRLAAERRLDALFQLIRAGRMTLLGGAVEGAATTSLDIVTAQQNWADALRGEFQAVTDYNNALVRFERAKGTIMEHDNVTIGEGPLPTCAQVRAVEHERMRALALAARERSEPVVHPMPDAEHGVVGFPQLPEHSAPSLPALFEGQGSPLPDKPDQKEPPRALPKLGPVRTEPPRAPALAAAPGIVDEQPPALATLPLEGPELPTLPAPLVRQAGHTTPAQPAVKQGPQVPVVAPLPPPVKESQPPRKVLPPRPFPAVRNHPVVDLPVITEKTAPKPIRIPPSDSDPWKPGSPRAD